MEMKKLVAAILLATAMAGCGGGGSGSNNGSNNNGSGITLSGVVAAGLAIPNATVDVKDAHGNIISVTTLTDGTYSLPTNNLTAPVLIRAPKSGGGYWYSVATAAGTANVHPLSDLIVRNWFKVQGTDVDTAFTTAGTMPAAPTTQDILTIESVVSQILSPYLKGANVDPATFNLINTPFNANHTGFDLVLDNLSVTQPATAGGNVTVALTGGGSGSNILSVPDSTAISSLPTPPAPVSDTSAPTIPGTITASRTGTAQVVLSWPAATDNIGVAGYRVYLNGTQVGITDQAFYVNDPAPADNTACYTVAAYDAAGNASGQNAQVCAGTSIAAADTTPPTAPVLTAVDSTTSPSSAINLSWTAATDTGGVAGYRVMVGGTAVATLNAAATAYSVTGLAAGSSFSFAVVAIDTSGNATTSNVATASTAAALDTTPPTQPTNLTGTVVSSSQIDISWTASNDNVGVTGYKVYYGSTLIGSSPTTSFSAINLTANTQYCVTVKAYDAAGNLSAASVQGCATTAASSGSGSTSTVAAGITATTTAWQNLFATSLPTTASFGSLFTSTFLDNGRSYAQWANNNGMTSDSASPDTSLIGMTLGNLQVLSVDATGTVAQIQFSAFNAAGVNISGLINWQAKLNAATGQWQFDGNQRIMYVSVKAFAEHSTCGPTCNSTIQPDTYATGLAFDASNSSQPVGAILVTGPGLPTSGVALAPVTTGGWQITTANTTGCQDAWWTQWCMGDADILSATAGSSYTFKLYDTTSGSPVLVGTYTEVLNHAPVLNTALSSQAYPTLTNLPNLSTTPLSSATTLTPTWTIPTGEKGDGTGAYVWQSSTGISANVPWTSMWAAIGSGTASIAVPAPASGVWDSAVWDINALDMNETISFRTHYR